jgi:AraC-like DNA-binding protein
MSLARERARLDTVAVRLIRLEVAPFGSGFLPAPTAGRPQWRFSFHERGRAVLVSPERAFALTPGRAVLISPELAADAKPEGDASGLAALFELATSRGGAAPGPSDGPVVLDPNALRDGLARGLLEGLNSGAPPTASQISRAHALIHLCVASALETAAERERSGNGVVFDARSQLQPALRYIDAHLAELLPNAKLAELAHASESHFIRMFRRVFGRTPARHVQERRVASAADLLLGTGLSIDEIAERCGFANRYHFSRVFAQRMSHPPARFRSLHAERSERAGFDTSP